MHISATLARPRRARKSAFRIEQRLPDPDVIQRVTPQTDEPHKSIVYGDALNAREPRAINRPPSCHNGVRKLQDSQDQKKVIKCASLPPREINGVVVSVDEGTGVIRAYEAMVYGVKQNDPAVQEKWKRLLLQYCRLDSLSMYMVWAHWRGQVF